MALDYRIFDIRLFDPAVYDTLKVVNTRVALSASEAQDTMAAGIVIPFLGDYLDAEPITIPWRQSWLSVVKPFSTLSGPIGIIQIEAQDRVIQILDEYPAAAAKPRIRLSRG